MPIVWLILLLIWAVITKNSKRKKRLIYTTLLLFVFFSNEMIVNEVYHAWEIPPTPINKLQKFDYAIVLSGITKNDSTLTDRVSFKKGVDRLNHAHLLYKNGNVKKFLLTGGSGRLTNVQRLEAELMKEALLQWEVPRRDILIETASKNTHQNAVNSVKLLKQEGIWSQKSFVLITSAFHMRRASGCFKKEGLNFTMFSTDFYSIPRRSTPDYWLLPSVSAFSKWHLIIHEVTGYVVYIILGYC